MDKSYWTDEVIKDLLSLQGINIFKELKENLTEDEYLDFIDAYEDWQERHKHG